MTPPTKTGERSGIQSRQKTGIMSCSEDAGERDVTRDGEDDDEDAERAECGEWNEREEDAEGAGDSFAAFEAEPDGEDMAEDGSDAGGDGEIRREAGCAGSEVLRRS